MSYICVIKTNFVAENGPLNGLWSSNEWDGNEWEVCLLLFYFLAFLFPPTIGYCLSKALALTDRSSSILGKRPTRGKTLNKSILIFQMGKVRFDIYCRKNTIVTTKSKNSKFFRYRLWTSNFIMRALKSHKQIENNKMLYIWNAFFEWKPSYSCQPHLFHK